MRDTLRKIKQETTKNFLASLFDDLFPNADMLSEKNCKNLLI